MAVLVTGGAGFIGSHTVLQLIAANHQVVILDNLSNASPLVLERIELISGESPAFYQGDVRDPEILRRIFAEHTIDAVLHFAGLKSVAESVREPEKYADNNINGTRILIEEMAKAGVFHIVFSSSATVYGDPAKLPITEDMPIGDTANPYGDSKYQAENLLRDVQAADNRFSVVLLRYFNPIGAHESGLIGENPNGIPNNLLPYICQVAIGKLDELSVYGNDYPTRDGTAIRDYIHVEDLAAGHLAAMATKKDEAGVHVYNLGTGSGFTVSEVVQAFELVSGIGIPRKIAPRREGDVAACYADASKAKEELGWQANKDLFLMLRDAWRWQMQNPNGYEDA